MVPPEKHDKEKDSFIKRVLKNENLGQGAHFFWKKRIEFLAGALMLMGIILSFFYSRSGGALVGLGFGVCFFDEIYNSFLKLRDFYTEQGLFKTLMWIATILFFLISIPAFIIAAAIGFGAIFVIRWSFKK